MYMKIIEGGNMEEQVEQVVEVAVELPVEEEVNVFDREMTPEMIKVYDRLDSMKGKTIMFIDLEFGGLFTKNHGNAEICEIGVIIREPGKKDWTFNRLCRIAQKLHPYVKRMTGITDQKLRNKRFFTAYVLQVRDMIERSDFVVFHGSDADIGVLRRYGVRIPEEKLVDTYKIVRTVFPNMRKANLQYLCELFEVEPEKAHRAIADCKMTIKVLEKLTETRNI